MWCVESVLLETEMELKFGLEQVAAVFFVGTAPCARCEVAPYSVIDSLRPG
jgi:hypothetical protein